MEAIKLCRHPLKRDEPQLPKSEGAKWRQEYGSVDRYLARAQGSLYV